jgi:hypothetical protein
MLFYVGVTRVWCVTDFAGSAQSLISWKKDCVEDLAHRLMARTGEKMTGKGVT